MSLFGEQLSARLRNDRQAVTKGEQLLGAALGGRKASAADGGVPGRSAMQQMSLIVEYFGLQEPDVIDHGQSVGECVDEVVRATNMIRRGVRLIGSWWKDADGPLLAVLSDGSGTIALFPGAVRGLYFYDAATGAKVRVTAENAKLFSHGDVHPYLRGKRRHLGRA
jgi:hypothetical protein